MNGGELQIVSFRSIIKQTTTSPLGNSKPKTNLMVQAKNKYRFVQMPQVTCIEESFSKPWLLDVECQRDDGSSSSNRCVLGTASW